MKSQKPKHSEKSRHFAYLDEKEWNFSSVSDDERPWCVLWEYARSSPATWVESTVKDWLGRKLGDGGSVGEFLIKYAARSPFFRQLRLQEKLAEAQGLAPASLKTHEMFLELVTHLPVFPQPWTSILPNRRRTETQKLADRFKGLCWPLIWEPSSAPVAIQSFMRDLLPDPTSNAILNHLCKEHAASRLQVPLSFYILAIDWTKYRHKDTVAELKGWLKSESNRQRKKRTGRDGPSASEFLRYLVAWRFKKAGFTFVEAQRELDKVSRQFKGKSLWLPKTTDKTRWSDDIAAARKHASVTFPNPNRT